MTFLQLVKELARLAGMAGNDGPPTVAGQHGEFRRAISFVQIAYQDVLNLHADWDFMWAHDSYEVDASLALYPPPPDLLIWDARKVYLDGEPLDIIDWEDYRPEKRSPARPQCAVRRPDNQLLLVPAPSGDFTLDFDYYRKPKPLASDSDEPMIPEPFQRVILGRALMLYGNYENAEDAKQQGMELYRMYLDPLERHQLSRRQQTHGRQESMPITVVAS